MGSNVRFISLSEIFVAIDLYTKNRTVFTDITAQL